ncbi:MAG: flagellar hook-length control protein FliK [Clostridium sp.]|jgi:hypothetical protein|nr:flagellar hook-length control protein FliK [Clostridium sp.]
MRLSDFFQPSGKKGAVRRGEVSGLSPKAGSGSGASEAQRNAFINRQIRAFVPGQTIQGEVVGRNGTEVQIRLAEDIVITARLEQSVHLEAGKSLFFQVKNNGASLVLNPLFANTAVDVNALKALEMASLPVNDMTVRMTQAMMKAGLSVDRQALQQLFREISAYSDTALDDILDLHQLGLPVTRENLAQAASYKNLTHQLVTGMDSVLEGIPSAIGSLVQEGNVDGAARLFREVIGQVTRDWSVPDGENAERGADGLSSGQEISALPSGLGAGSLPDGQERNVLPDGQESASPEMQARGEDRPVREETLETPVRNPAGFWLEESFGKGGTGENVSLADKFLGVLRQLPLSGEESRLLSGSVKRLGDGTLSGRALLELTGSFLRAARTVGADGGKWIALLTDTGLNRLAAQALREKWTIRPEEVREKGNVTALYERMNRQLHSLAQALEQAGGGGAAAGLAKGLDNMTQNLNFLHQLNQMYAYVQLPLKHNGGDAAHGELYVYTDKKHLASADGTLTALLHLDMEHLGPVDVYVTLQGSRASTRFTVREDEMLDFLAANMDLLNRRLKGRGYDMKYELLIREEQEESPVERLLNQGNGRNVPLAQYAFDVRA